MSAEPWYSVKCIFEHSGLTELEGATVYEERVVVLRATSLDDAIIQGEIEAAEYSRGTPGVRYAGYIDAFHLLDPEVTDGTEVYSLMRESILSPNAYLDRYYDTGDERTQTWEPKATAQPPLHPALPQKDCCEGDGTSAGHSG